MWPTITSSTHAELTVKPLRRVRTRVMARTAIRSEPYALTLDLVVAGFAIVGALLISLVR
jgi:hypothetical protein